MWQNGCISSQNYIVSTPYPHGSSDESDNDSFPDIDYDVHYSLDNKLKSFEYDDINASFPDTQSFDYPPRTLPIKIKQSKSKTSRSHTKKLLLCPFNSSSDIDDVCMNDLNMVALHSSVTAHTPEPFLEDECASLKPNHLQESSNKYQEKDKYHHFTQFSYISNHKRMSNAFEMSPMQIGM